jgi:hypothetical protein
MKNTETDGIQLDKSFSIFTVDKRWDIKGVGDFDNDGKQNILWQNATRGENAIWGIVYTPAANKISETFTLNVDKTKFIKSTPIGWSMNGWADFNNDNVLDIVWSNKSTGENAIWELNSNASASDPYFSKGYLIQNTGANSGWGIEGIGDFNNDGINDIFWKNVKTNELAFWNMGISNEKTQISKSYLIDNPASTQWEIIAVANTDLDSTPEIVWTNYSSGENAIWDMKVTNGDVSLNKGYFLPTSDDLNWRFGTIAYGENLAK